MRRNTHAPISAGFADGARWRRRSVAAQQTPATRRAGQQPAVTFRTETNFVEVHAIVTDQKGAFVKDLTRDDFEIYEDGRLQAPTVFSLVDVPLETSVHPAQRHGADRAGRARDDAHLRRPHLHPPARRPSYQRHAHEQRPRSRQEVHQRIPRRQRSRRRGLHQRSAGVRAGADQQPPAAEGGDRRFQGQKLPSAGAEKLALHLREIANQDGHARKSRRRFARAEGLQQAQSIRDPFDTAAGVQRPPVVGGHRERLPLDGDVQGRRKALLFFSEGFDYDIYQPFDIGRESSSIVAEAREAAAAAQRANVNVYGIDPRGMSQFGEMIEINARSGLSTARLRHVPRPAARTAARAGKPDLALRRDRRHARSSTPVTSPAAWAASCSTTAGTTCLGTTATPRSGRATSS